MASQAAAIAVFLAGQVDLSSSGAPLAREGLGSLPSPLLYALPGSPLLARLQRARELVAGGEGSSPAPESWVLPSVGPPFLQVSLVKMEGLSLRSHRHLLLSKGFLSRGRPLFPHAEPGAAHLQGRD